jgi:hypothetical protein
VTRECFANETWSAKADYSGCVPYDDTNVRTCFSCVQEMTMAFLGHFIVSLEDYVLHVLGGVCGVAGVSAVRPGYLSTLQVGIALD